jgi:hypothetical protein
MTPGDPLQDPQREDGAGGSIGNDALMAVRCPPMRRLARHLFTLCSAASLLLFVAVCVLWARSHRHIDIVSWRGPGHELTLWDIDGIVQVVYAADGSFAGSRRRPQTELLVGWTASRMPMRPGLARENVSVPAPNRWGFGFSSRRTVGRPQGNWRFGGRPLLIVYVPYGLLAAVAAVLPAVRLARAFRRRRRRRAGRCPACGYDLRASPERCPECGTSATPVS